MKNILLTAAVALWGMCVACHAQTADRWRIEDNGAIRWETDGRLPHFDHVEMSGQRLSVVLRYGVLDVRVYKGKKLVYRKKIKEGETVKVVFNS